MRPRTGRRRNGGPARCRRRRPWSPRGHRSSRPSSRACSTSRRAEIAADAAPTAIASAPPADLRRRAHLHAARGGHLLDALADGGDLAGDAAEHLAGRMRARDALAHPLGALSHRLRGGRRVGARLLDGRDDPSDPRRGLGGRGRQAAHLAGHDREAAAVLAGVGGLDRRVERQQVGLPGDPVDGPGDRADLVEARSELVDGAHEAGCVRDCLFEVGDHMLDQLAALARVLARLGGARGPCPLPPRRSGRRSRPARRRHSARPARGRSCPRSRRAARVR